MIQPNQTTVDTLTKELPKNVIRNQKYTAIHSLRCDKEYLSLRYNPLTFIFVVLYNEFKFFFNLYFLIVALSQFIPVLQIGTNSRPTRII